jgi:hypothetical protein
MSIFALMMSAVAARARPHNAEIAALQAQIDDLRRGFDEVLAQAERQRDEWRNLAMSYQNVMHGQRMQATQQQQYSMLAQNGPMISQNFAQALSDFVCNCVPTRHDAFKGIMNSD